MDLDEATTQIDSDQFTHHKLHTVRQRPVLSKQRSKRTGAAATDIHDPAPLKNRKTIKRATLLLPAMMAPETRTRIAGCRKTGEHRVSYCPAPRRAYHCKGPTPSPLVCYPRQNQGPNEPSCLEDAIHGGYKVCAIGSRFQLKVFH